MDQMTLQWIANSRPVNFDAAPSLPRPGLMLVPEPDWFVTPRLSASNHGIRHNARVSLLAALLAEEQGLNSDDIAAACVAGAVHDCRRLDDREDPGHGQRAASWFRAHTSTVTGALGREVPEASLQRAAEAVAVHDVPYGRFTARQERAYRDAPHLVDVLKAADCMDRYRLPLQRWWPDTTRLRIPVPDWMSPAAFALVVRSEQAALDGATQREALDLARQTLTP
ncbi:HD domain-containing protein [Streptomyces sp. NPDC101213]|uniref:HD domain-containing protein n=1 Tax=Streptomyces sp. NPDC101213 TaxID=3366130 RepID=UPI0038003B56